MPEIKLEDGLYAIYPVSIAEIEKTDLPIIPSVSYDYENSIPNNAKLIDWVRTYLNLMLLLVEKYINGQTAIFCSKIFQIELKKLPKRPSSFSELRKIMGMT